MNFKEIAKVAAIVVGVTIVINMTINSINVISSLTETKKNN